MRRPFALIFDMDGVIVDSTPAHTEAWRMYLSQHGITADDIAGRMLGKRNDEIVRDFFGSSLEQGDVARHGAGKEEVYRQLMGPQLSTRLVPGVVEFVRSWPDVPMGLATNAEPANVEFILEGAGLLGCFRAIVNGHQVAQPKPFPDMYLRICELLGVEPHRAVVFEDSLAGVAAARAAGTKVVGLLTTVSQFPQDAVNFSIQDFRDPRLVPWVRALQNDA